MKPSRLSKTGYYQSQETLSKMRFKKIRLSNIRSYKDQEITFPDGSLLLSGDVGCGKTSILMALEYALFGLQPGQKGNALLRNNENFGEVSLELEIQGRTVLIERKLKRTPKGVSNEYAAITIDGIKNESSVTEIKSKIVSLLGYPSEFVKKNNILYRYTVHTAQEQMKEIILEDPETRVNILRHVFGVDKYRIIKENFGLKKAELESKTKSRQEVESELASIEESLEEKRKYEQEIEKTKIHISTKRELLSRLMREEEESKKLLSDSKEIFRESALKELVGYIQAKREDLDKLNTKNIDTTAKYSRFEQEQNEILAKKERIFKIDICPTCLQDVPEHHKHNILNDAEAKLSSIKNQLESLEKERKNLFELIKLNKQQLTDFEENRWKMEVLKNKQEQIERAKTKLIEITRQKESLSKDQDLLLSHIEGLRGRILEYSPFEIKFKTKELELKKALSEEKNVEISLAELVRELEISHKEIALFQEMIKKKEQSKTRLYKLNELSDWLSTQFLKLIDTTERNVLLKLRKEFSSLFRKWFLMLISENRS